MQQGGEISIKEADSEEFFTKISQLTGQFFKGTH
jgi:hypothetical protein